MRFGRTDILRAELAEAKNEVTHLKSQKFFNWRTRYYDLESAVEGVELKLSALAAASDPHRLTRLAESLTSARDTTTPEKVWEQLAQMDACDLERWEAEAKARAKA